jgi:hypothetical protein
VVPACGLGDCVIISSREKPKICGNDDAEVVAS